MLRSVSERVALIEQRMIDVHEKSIVIASESKLLVERVTSLEMKFERLAADVALTTKLSWMILAGIIALIIKSIVLR